MCLSAVFTKTNQQVSELICFQPEKLFWLWTYSWMAPSLHRDKEKGGWEQHASLVAPVPLHRWCFLPPSTPHSPLTHAPLTDLQWEQWPPLPTVRVMSSLSLTYNESNSFPSPPTLTAMASLTYSESKMSSIPHLQWQWWPHWPTVRTMGHQMWRTSSPRSFALSIINTKTIGLWINLSEC